MLDKESGTFFLSPRALKSSMWKKHLDSSGPIVGTGAGWGVGYKFRHSSFCVERLGIRQGGMKKLNNNIAFTWALRPGCGEQGCCVP